MVGIVVDSAAALDQGRQEAEGIQVVPLLLEVDGRSVEETSLGPAELAELLRSGRVRTAAPSPGAFLAAMERCGDAEGVLVLTVGRRYSSSAESARLAAAQFDRPAAVVDTRTAAGAEALVALAAASASRAGLALDALAKHAEEVSRRVRLVAEVGDLTYLSRSGRLPKRLASLANSVGLRPVFELRNGSIRLLRPGLSQRAALRLMVDTWRRSLLAEHRLHLAVMHGGEVAAAEEILQEISAEVEPATSLVTRFGPAMVAHTGPDIDGFAWWWEPSSGRLADGESR